MTATTDQCESVPAYRVRVADDDVQSDVCTAHLHAAISAAHDDLQAIPTVQIVSLPGDARCDWTE